jgi:hypothetical protein
MAAPQAAPSTPFGMLKRVDRSFQTVRRQSLRT